MPYLRIDNLTAHVYVSLYNDNMTDSMCALRIQKELAPPPRRRVIPYCLVYLVADLRQLPVYTIQDLPFMFCQATSLVFLNMSRTPAVTTSWTAPLMLHTPMMFCAMRYQSDSLFESKLPELLTIRLGMSAYLVPNLRNYSLCRAHPSVYL